ncbi:MAG: beta-ketoacyl synthase chain length factor [Bacteroidetes bacterium]|nr:beta-ketoacyl synthase chain length factor [Bacteroidota bacterium]
MKQIYITGTGAITPQQTFDNSAFLDQVQEYYQNNLTCVDPNYKDFIPPLELRRMSRINRIGLSSAKICLNDAQMENPDAIITGTGMGCVEDTEKFLMSMIENGEQLLTPTSFIRSTHNTVGAQIAVHLKCHNYNFTYVHRGFSFESALTDAMLLIKEGEAHRILVGGIDETSENNFKILSRLGYWKENPIRNLDLLSEKTNGTISGEGSVFVMLSDEPGKKNYGRLMAVDTFLNPDCPETINYRIISFLEENNMKPGNIDLTVMGYSGDMRYDSVFDQMYENLFSDRAQVYYKHLCGEYHTASAFGFWTAIKILETQHIPEPLIIKRGIPKEINNILIYNHFMNQHHTLMLLSR